MFCAMVKSVLTCLALAAGLAFSPLSPARAESPYASVITAEILPGWETARGTQMVGLRLKLAPEWKTYWRAPGDAGIPPRFEWSGSENLRSADLFWPRPEVIYQNGMRTIAYKHEVVLPIELTPQRPGAPITLNGVVELGVCLDICMPMEFALHADLPAAPEPAPIRAALAQRPVPGYQAGVGDVICSATPLPDGLRLTTRITVPPLGGKEVAVVELADPSIWVAEAEVSRRGNELTAVTDLVPANAAPFALDRSGVRITLLSDSRAIDIQGCVGG
jgi:hypothetical protein